MSQKERALCRVVENQGEPGHGAANYAGGEPGQEAGKQAFLYPHMKPPAMADDLIPVESAAPTPTIAATFDADFSEAKFPATIRVKSNTYAGILLLLSE